MQVSLNDGDVGASAVHEGRLSLAPSSGHESTRFAGGIEHQRSRPGQNVWPQPADVVGQGHDQRPGGLVDVRLNIERARRGEVLQRVPVVPVGCLSGQPRIEVEAIAGQEAAGVRGLLGDSIPLRVLGEEACTLHRHFMTTGFLIRCEQRRGHCGGAEQHAEQQVRTLDSISDIADVELSTDQETSAWGEFRGRRSIQADGDLGERIYLALASALASGRSKVVILGSDSPTLPAAHLRALLAPEADVVLGPTVDGGFYAICCRKVVPGMLTGVEWSAAHTLKSTLEALASRGLSVDLGPAWFDVDEVTDVQRLRDSSSLPRHTRLWFARYDG